jgi:DNA-binding beta-propeller fold protein YncE
MKAITRFGIILLVMSSYALADGPAFKLTKRYAVPGNGGFDYIVFDSSSNRLYVSHGDSVDVLDADSGKQLGQIRDTPGIHGVAIVAKLHRGFTTNGGDSSVSVFDTHSLRTIKKLRVPKGPDFVFYDPSTNRVLVCHEDAAAITLIDPARAVAVGRIDLGGGPEAAVISGKGVGFVNIEAAAAVVSFDPRTLSVRTKWPIQGCSAPVPLAIDNSNSRLFIGCRSKVLAVMNADNGKVITTLPIGDTVDAVIFDTDSRTIFASTGDGTISVIHQENADQYRLIGAIPTQKSAKTMAFDPITKRLFLSAAQMETLGKGSTARIQPKPGTFGVLVVEPQH